MLIAGSGSAVPCKCQPSVGTVAITAQFQAPAVDEWAFVPATDMFLVVGEAGHRCF